MTVSGRRSLTDRVEEFRFRRPDLSPLPGWTPGSHIDVHLPAPQGAGTVRQYSLCSDPGTDEYRIAVDLRPDSRGGSRAAHDYLVPGAHVRVSRPRNHFPLVRALNYVFIAAGVGVTLVLPLVGAADAAGRPWRLILLARTAADMPYADELEQRYPDRVTVHESASAGRLDMTTALAGLPRGTAVYVCGPTGLVPAVEAACAGQPAVDVFAERFTAADQTAVTNAPFELALALSGRTMTIPADRSILDVLDAESVLAPSSCREGVCGTCETGVVTGAVDHRDTVLSPEERAENDTMMICVSRCTSGRLVIDL